MIYDEEGKVMQLSSSTLLVGFFLEALQLVAKTEGDVRGEIYHCIRTTHIAM